MEISIGDRSNFAIKLDILKFEPHIWGKSVIYFNNKQLGNYNDENNLFPFINSIKRISLLDDSLRLEELEGFTCKEIFSTINPFFKRPDKIYELSEPEQEVLTKYDRFNLFFGENFDNYLINAVTIDQKCKFLWIENLGEVDENFNDDLINCFEVDRAYIHSIYMLLCKEIADLGH